MYWEQQYNSQYILIKVTFLQNIILTSLQQKVWKTVFHQVSIL